MKVRKGDTVIVISGKDRGKSGSVLKVIPKKDMVLVEGIAVVKKHQKARRQGQTGQILDRSMPIHISNVALKDPKSGKPTRVRMTTEGDKKFRVAAKSGSKI